MGRKHVYKTVECRCDKCGLVTRSVPGKKHRNCGGDDNAQPRTPDKRVSRENRGKWQPA